MAVKLKFSILLRIVFLGIWHSSALPPNLSLSVCSTTLKSPAIILVLSGNLLNSLKVLPKKEVVEASVLGP